MSMPGRPVPDVEPPQSLEMEQATLGAILYDPSVLETVASILKPSDFYRSAHGFILESLLALAERQEPIDLLTLQDDLKSRELLEACGGAPYLVGLTDACPTVTNHDYYARQVLEKSVLRQLLAAASQIYSIALRVGDDVEDASDALTRSQAALDEVLGNIGGTEIAGEIAADALPDDVEMPTLWFGLYPGMSVLLIGESGAGKSSLLYNIILQAGRNLPLWGEPFRAGRPLRVLYLEKENAGDWRNPDVSKRYGGVCRKKLNRIMEPGEVPPPTISFMDAVNLDLSHANDTRKLLRRIKRGFRGHPFDLVVFDPVITLFHVKEENSNAEMSAVAESLRGIARQTGACVVATHHTGKSAMNGILSGRGGSGLVGPFDVVMTLRAHGKDDDEQDEEYRGEPVIKKDVCRLRIEKDRPGQFGQKSALYLQMGVDGLDRFRRVGFEEWRSSTSAPDGTKAGQAEGWIVAFLQDNPGSTFAHIKAVLGGQVGDKNLRAALQNLLRSRKTRVQNRGRGGLEHYSLVDYHDEMSQEG